MWAKKLLRFFLWFFGVLIGLIASLSAVTQFVPEKPPADFVMTKNFIDLSQVLSMSKYRSCNGHKTLPQYANEPPSNMQHYIMTKEVFGPDENRFKIFAPFDGYATDSIFQASEGITFFTKSQKPWWPFNQWRFNVPHGHLKSGLNGIVKVKAGDLVGYGDSGLDQSEPGSLALFESQVRIGVLAIPPQFKDHNSEPWKKLDSVFHYMNDEVFAEYQRAFPGLENREQMIITREERLADPCKYRDNRGPFFESSEDQFIRGNVFTGVGLNNPEKARIELNKIWKGCYSLDSVNKAPECSE